MQKISVCVVLSCLITSSAWAAGPTASDVGDVASFGRTAKWMGVGQTSTVQLTTDCTGFSGGPGDRCITLSPAPGFTSFDERDLGVIRLPAKVTNSLVCHFVSPFFFYHLTNTTAAPAIGQVRFSPYATVENAVLSDPSLIDPSTGAPFGGSYETSIPGSVRESRTMAPGDQQSTFDQYSRVCIAGLISRQGLIGMGLSDAQATDFFKNPITIRLHLRGNARLVDDASLFYGLRLLGD